jgi:hypothetical protein
MKAAILLTFAAFLPTCTALAKPTRAECIVGYRLDWRSVKAERADVLNQMDIPNDLARRVALAGVSFGTGEAVFLQFSQGCETKNAKAAEILGYWKTKTRQLPEFVPMTDVIRPGLQTIEIQGPHWRD